MKLVVDLGGRRAHELHLSPSIARLQIENVIRRHDARGHGVEKAAPEIDKELHYFVTTPEGQLEYWLE